jgi:hypothetical protein
MKVVNHLKMKKFLILIIALTWCVLNQAQDFSTMRTSYTQPDLRFFYVSSLIYPGISAGIEFPFTHPDSKSWTRQKRTEHVSERFISGNLSWYHHAGFHDNIFLTAEWVMRRTKSTGFISEFSAGPGFSHTFLSGTTYKVSESGTISIERLAGYNYALIKLGGGFGYDFSAKGNMPLSSIATLSIISMFPYNSTVYFRPVLEIGVIYNVSGFGKEK